MNCPHGLVNCPDFACRNACREFVSLDTHHLQLTIAKHTNMIEKILEQSARTNSLINQLSCTILELKYSYDKKEVPQSHKSMQSNLLKPKREYKYSLGLVSQLPCPVIKSKKFKIQVELLDKDSQRVKNQNRIGFDLQIFSSDISPKVIENSNIGHQMLKYSLESSLQDGFGIINKVQINDVTSRFRNGWIYLQIALARQNVKMQEGDISPQEVCPLLLKKIVVKSKQSRQQE